MGERTGQGRRRAIARPPATPPRARPTRPGTWNAELVAAAIRDWAKEVGAPPRSYQWSPATGRLMGYLPADPVKWEREHPHWPSTQTVRRYFGTFSAALRAAGFHCPPRPPPAERSERVDAARRLRGGGETIAAIALELEVSARTVRAYLAAGRCPRCGGHKIVERSRTCPGCQATRSVWPQRTRGQLLERLRAWSDQTGASPTSSDWAPADVGGHPKWQREFPAWPPISAVFAEFGSWSAALEDAGLSRHRHVWTPELAIEAIRRWQHHHGRPPTHTEWATTDNGDHPSHTTLTHLFGGFSAAVRAAGLAPNRHELWTRDEILTQLKRFSHEYGRPPRSLELAGPTVTDFGFPSTAAVRRAFGTFSAALRAVGLEPGNPPQVTEQQILEALRSYQRQHGPPSARRWQRDHLRPSVNSIIRRFGSWSRALRAAGLEPHQQPSHWASPR